MSIDCLDLETNANFLWSAPSAVQESTPAVFTQTIHQTGSQWADFSGKLNSERITTFESNVLFQESQGAWMNWFLETGIWDGYEITSDTAALKQEEMEERFWDWFSSLDPSSDLYQNMMMQLAALGGDPELKAFAEEMNQPGYKQTGGIWHCFKKGYKKTAEFCHDHPYIAAGIAIVVAAAVVTIVVVCSGGGAGVAAVAGAAGAVLGDGPDERPVPHPIPSAPVADIPAPFPQPIETLETTPPFKIPGERIFLENGMVMDGKFNNYRDILNQGKEREFLDSLKQKTTVAEQPLEEKSKLYQFYESLNLDKFNPENQNLVWTAAPPLEKSPQLHSFVNPKRDYFSNPISKLHQTPGARQSHIGIGMINGINTSFEEAVEHSSYLSGFASGQSVDLVYNQSHGVVGGLLESLFLNHGLGYSPNTAQLSRDIWTQFHEANIDNPKAKFLHFCHSQGTIHTLNALYGCPKEIRDRLIVVAIAPGAVIPSDLCYQSFNYACKNDIVHLGQLIAPSAMNTHEFRNSERLEMIMEDRKELIKLDAHPDSIGLGHSFQDPTFRGLIEKRIQEYLDNNGEYE